MAFYNNPPLHCIHWSDDILMISNDNPHSNLLVNILSQLNVSTLILTTNSVYMYSDVCPYKQVHSCRRLELLLYKNLPHSEVVTTLSSNFLARKNQVYCERVCNSIFFLILYCYSSEFPYKKNGGWCNSID